MPARGQQARVPGNGGGAPGGCEPADRVLVGVRPCRRHTGRGDGHIAGPYENGGHRTADTAPWRACVWRPLGVGGWASGDIGTTTVGGRHVPSRGPRGQACMGRRWMGGRGSRTPSLPSPGDHQAHGTERRRDGGKKGGAEGPAPMR